MTVCQVEAPGYWLSMNDGRKAVKRSDVRRTDSFVSNSKEARRQSTWLIQDPEMKIRRDDLQARDENLAVSCQQVSQRGSATSGGQLRQVRISKVGWQG